MSTLYKLTRSSTDPKQLSMTVQGILVGLVPLIITLTGLTKAQLNEIIDAVVNVVYLGTSLVAAAYTVWGLIRKAFNRRWSAAE